MLNEDLVGGEGVRLRLRREREFEHGPEHALSWLDNTII